MTDTTDGRRETDLFTLSERVGGRICVMRERRRRGFHLGEEGFEFNACVERVHAGCTVPGCSANTPRAAVPPKASPKARRRPAASKASRAPKAKACNTFLAKA